MPTLIEDLAEGLSIVLRDGQHFTATRKYHAYGLGTGDNLTVLASAFAIGTLPGPTSGITILIPGTLEARSIYPNSYEARPFGDDEAEITVGYSEIQLAIPASSEFGPCRVSGGTTLRQVETEFDYNNLQLPFANREPISVTYEGDDQGGRVPMFMPESAVTFTRFENTYPGGRSREYAGTTNSDDYEGCPPDTLLMWAVTFDHVATSLWQTSYTMVYDPHSYWRQVLRYIGSDGLPPKLTNSDVSSENGIKEVTTQGQTVFASLDIVVA